MDVAPQKAPEPQRASETAKQDAAPIANAPTAATATPQKQEALQQAGDAALTRMGAEDKGPRGSLTNPTKVSTASAFAHVDLAQAEAIVTAVDGEGHPTFDVTMHLPVATLLSAGISAADLSHITGVENMGGAIPDAVVSARSAGDGVDLAIKGASSLNGVNANGYKLVLANGQSIAITVETHAFHTDVTEWDRSGIRLEMKQQQESLDGFEKTALDDQKDVDHPPPPDTTKGDAELATALAQLDATNAKIAARVTELSAEWQSLDPGLRAATVSRLEGPIAGQGQQLAALNNQRQALVGQKKNADQLSQTLHAAVDGWKGTPPAGVVAEMKQTDAQAASLASQIADVDAKIGAASTALMQALQAQKDVLETMLAEYEDEIARGENKKPDATLDTLLGERGVYDGQARLAREHIAEEVAVADKMPGAAKVRVAGDNQMIAQVQQRIADAQKRLDALKGPVFATIGEDGKLAPPPGAAASGGAAAGSAKT